MLQALYMFADACKEDNHFFGLRPWYHYINDSTHFNGCDIKKFTFLPGAGQDSDIPLVLLAVIDDLLRIAGIVAVGFVIYGAIKLIASQGSSESTAKARGTIINALVGMAIAIVAVAFVSYLGSRLGR
jgi:hypothetical protein